MSFIQVGEHFIIRCFHVDIWTLSDYRIANGKPMAFWNAGIPLSSLIFCQVTFGLYGMLSFAPMNTAVPGRSVLSTRRDLEVYSYLADEPMFHQGWCVEGEVQSFQYKVDNEW